jgi:hypothetical protein
MSNITVVDGWPVLNSFPPLAFLPPQIAYQVEISRYVLVGTLGVSFPVRWFSGRPNEPSGIRLGHPE